MVDAHPVQGLLRQERERHGISAAGIADDAARSYFRRHLLRFNRPEAMHLLAIVVKDPKLAETLLRQADGTSQQEFKALAARHSTDQPPWWREASWSLMPTTSKRPRRHRPGPLPRRVQPAPAW